MDTAVVSRNATYEVPNKDIEIWIFISSSRRERQKRDIYSQEVSKDVGGIISFEGVLIRIPPNILPEDAVIHIKKLTDEEIEELTLPTEMLRKLCSDIIEITSSGQREFGKDNFIEIRIPLRHQK